MAGSKTRPGFSGGDESPPSDTEEGPRAARTIIGHDVHLPSRPNPAPAASVPPSPAVALPNGVPEAITEETTEELPPRPSHSGKSKFPALARFFGRWTTGGGFLSHSWMSGGNDDMLEVPRNVWVSRVAIFVLAALFSFLVALGVLKMHSCGGSVLPQSTVQPEAPPVAAPPPTDTTASPGPGPKAAPAPATLPPPATPSASPGQTDAAHSKSKVTGSPLPPAPTGVAPGVPGKPRIPRPDRLSPPPAGENREIVLPLRM